MCQACWALAARRSGDASIATPDTSAPRPRFSAVAEWVPEPEDDRDTDAAGDPLQPVDAQDG